jgi:chromosome segregation ATPase
VATYVEIYLRNESLRLRIFELEKTLGSLHTEFKRLDPSRTVLEQRIRSLEVSLESLKRELNSVPS